MVENKKINKTFIKTLLATALLFFCNSYVIKAQILEEVTISVSSTITSTIEIFTLQGIDFRGVNLELGVVTIDPVQNSNAGRMVARGNPNAEMRLNFLRNRELRNVNTNNTLNLEFLVAGNSTEEQSTAETLNQDSRDLQFNEDGEYFIWIGATVDLSLAEPGGYEGEFTIEIEYI